MMPLSSQRNQQITMKKPKKRVTMIKHVVGKVRTQPDPIPNVTFGIPNKIDEEGAGNVIQSWAQSEPMKSEKEYQSFPDTNRKALQNGCLNAKTQREYALKNPVMKSLTKKMSSSSSSSSNHYQRKAKNKNNDHPFINMNETYHHQQQQQQNSNEHHHVFGIRSIANDVPIQEMLKSVYGNFEEKDYPDQSHMQKKGKLPPAKSTIASRLLEASISDRNSNMNSSATSKGKKSVKNEYFKMNRFLKVESTVKAMLQQ